MSTNFVVSWKIQVVVSNLTVLLGVLCSNHNTIAIEVTSISEFPQHEGSAKDLQPVAELTPKKTPAATNKPEGIAQNPPAFKEEPDIELTVIDKLLNEPVYSPFRREGTVKDSTRPVYVITDEEMEAQGARTVREALKFLPGILPDGTVGTEVNALSGQFIRGFNSAQVLILLDGRPINDLGSGSFDLSEFTTNIVERVVPEPLYGQGYFNSLRDSDRKYTDQVLTDLTWNSKLGSGDDSLLTARVYADFLNSRYDSQNSSQAASLCVVLLFSSKTVERKFCQYSGVTS